MLNIHHIQIFINIVKTKSFSDTAKLMKVTASSVSKSMSSLESSLAVTLIKRDTRKLLLTEAGSQFYMYCIEIIKKIEEAKNVIDSLKSDPVGELRVISAHYFTKICLLPYLPQFLQVNPNINLSLENSERIPVFAKEKVDIVVGMSIPIKEPDVIQRTIGFTRGVLCASKSFIEKNKIKKISDLHKLPYLTHTIRNPDHILFLRNGEELDFKPYLKFNDSISLLEGLKKGLGFGYVLEYVARHALEKKDVFEIFKEEMPEAFPVYLFYKKDGFVAAKIRAFIDFYMERINEDKIFL